MLVHLPDGHNAEQVRDALTEKIKTIPDILRASLTTWDEGIEMHEWKDVRVAADIDIYFCDPHAPWQRATNENTNWLLRQYFPKGTDLSRPQRSRPRLGSPPSSTTDRANAWLREADRRDRTTTVALTASNPPAVTVPVATSSAANKLVVPLRS